MVADRLWQSRYPLRNAGTATHLGRLWSKTGYGKAGTPLGDPLGNPVGSAVLSINQTDSGRPEPGGLLLCAAIGIYRKCQNVVYVARFTPRQANKFPVYHHGLRPEPAAAQHASGPSWRAPRSSGRKPPGDSANTAVIGRMPAQRATRVRR